MKFSKFHFLFFALLGSWLMLVVLMVACQERPVEKSNFYRQIVKIQAEGR